MRIEAELKPKLEEGRHVARWAHHLGERRARVLADPRAGQVVREIALPHVLPHIRFLGQHREDVRGADAGLRLRLLRILKRIGELNSGRVTEREKCGAYR